MVEFNFCGKKNAGYFCVILTINYKLFDAVYGCSVMDVGCIDPIRQATIQ